MLNVLRKNVLMSLKLEHFEGWQVQYVINWHTKLACWNIWCTHRNLIVPFYFAYLFCLVTFNYSINYFLSLLILQVYSVVMKVWHEFLFIFIWFYPIMNALNLSWLFWYDASIIKYSLINNSCQIKSELHHSQSNFEWLISRIWIRKVFFIWILMW